MNDRDLVIDALAHSEATLVDRVIDLTSERDSYRALAQTALAHVSALTVRNDQLRQQNHDLHAEIADLHGELRRLLGCLMNRDRAA